MTRRSTLLRMRDLRTPPPPTGPATPSELALACSRGKWKRAPHLDIIETAVLDTIDRKSGVTLSAAVRHGKSEYASLWLPAWFLGRNPDKRVILATHEARFARSWGRRVRNVLAEYGPAQFGVHPDPGNAAANEWGIEGHDGGMVTVGVGGAPIGRGGDLCIASGTLVSTPQGAVDIDTLAHRGGTLWAYDHKERRTVEATIVGATESVTSELVEVQFTSGRIVRCTPDHQIYVNGHGYVEAGDLTPGATVTATREARMPVLRDCVPTDAERCGPVSPQRGGDVLQSPVRDTAPGCTPAGEPEAPRGGRIALRVLRRGRDYAGLGLGQEAASGPGVRLLRPEVLRDGATSAAHVRTVWGADRQEGPSVLLDLYPDPKIRNSDSVDPQRMPPLPLRVSAEVIPTHLLLPPVCKPGPRSTNDRPGKLPLPGRDELFRLVSKDAPADHRAGRRLRRVWIHNEATHPSHQRERVGQPAGESGDLVFNSPRRPPQIISDTVAVVRQARGDRHVVYDLEVEGCHNFFAGEILVHNCIVDDPIRSWEAAQSALQREKIMDWWTGTMESRREPGAAVVIICARWHEDDLTGALHAEAPDDWTDVRLPAICDDPENDPLGRAEGEPLWPERYDAEALAKTKGRVSLRLGSQVWDAQYQQRPSNPKGGMFTTEWPTIQRSIVDARTTGGWVRRWDLAATAAGGDWTVGVLMTKLSDDRFVVVDRVAGQWAPDDVRTQLQGCAVSDPPGTRIVLPQDPGQAGKDQAQQLVRMLAGYDVRTLPETGSKETRATGLAAQQRAGNVLLVEASWNRAFIAELAAFPKAKHDDQVDAAAGAFNALNGAVGGVAKVTKYHTRVGR